MLVDFAWQAVGQPEGDGLHDGATVEVRQISAPTDPAASEQPGTTILAKGNTTYPTATLTGFAFSTVYTVTYDLTTSSFAAYTDFNDTLAR